MVDKQRFWIGRQDSRRQHDIGALTGAVTRADAGHDCVAKPGMVLTIRYDASGETETFLLGRRFGKGVDVPVYSTLSPMGHAIAGARIGEQRIYSMPNGTRPLLVTLLEAVPYGMHVVKDTRQQSAGRGAAASIKVPRGTATPRSAPGDGELLTAAKPVA